MVVTVTDVTAVALVRFSSLITGGVEVTAVASVSLVTETEMGTGTGTMVLGTMGDTAATRGADFSGLGAASTAQAFGDVTTVADLDTLVV